MLGLFVANFEKFPKFSGSKMLAKYAPGVNDKHSGIF